MFSFCAFESTHTLYTTLVKSERNRITIHTIMIINLIDDFNMCPPTIDYPRYICPGQGFFVLGC